MKNWNRVTMRVVAATTLSLLVVVTLSSPVRASRPDAPLTNVPVSTAANAQYDPSIVSDGAGGAIVTWSSLRADGQDIYAQHLLPNGAVDHAWPLDGRAVCTAASNRGNATIASDGSGGAIIAWIDLRNGASTDIYAQHVLASGAVDPAWPADGRAVCTEVSDQYLYGSAIVSDDAGGAIVTWQDYRNVVIASDIYAQHVLASGAVDPGWPSGGRAVCTAADVQYFPTLVTDGKGGAIITWGDLRNDGTSDVYAQHVLVSGTVDPAWPPDGQALCVKPEDQASPTLVSDGASGAIVTWRDTRGGAGSDIYVQHVLTSGAVDPAWPAEGRALCVAPGEQYQFGTSIVSDGAAGAIVIWQDDRSSAGTAVYAHHVLASGFVDAAWPADGRALSTAASSQQEPRIASDGAGGAIVVWTDSRNGIYDIYAQHVLNSGATDRAWPADGQALCTAMGIQNSPALVSDGRRGAVVAWTDQRSDLTGGDIYAQAVRARSQLVSRGPHSSKSNLSGGGDVESGTESLSGLALEPVSNPSHRGSLGVRFTLENANAASLELLDVAGRRVVSRNLGAFDAGSHTVDLGQGLQMAPGVYFVRLRQGANLRVLRAVVVE